MEPLLAISDLRAYYQTELYGISPPASEPDRTQLTETYVKQDGRWRLKFQKALTK